MLREHVDRARTTPALARSLFNATSILAMSGNLYVARLAGALESNKKDMVQDEDEEGGQGGE